MIKTLLPLVALAAPAAYANAPLFSAPGLGVVSERPLTAREFDRETTGRRMQRRYYRVDKDEKNHTLTYTHIPGNHGCTGLGMRQAEAPKDADTQASALTVKTEQGEQEIVMGITRINAHCIQVAGRVPYYYMNETEEEREENARREALWRADPVQRGNGAPLVEKVILTWGAGYSINLSAIVSFGAMIGRNSEGYSSEDWRRPDTVSGLTTQVTLGVKGIKAAVGIGNIWMYWDKKAESWSGTSILANPMAIGFAIRATVAQQWSTVSVPGERTTEKDIYGVDVTYPTVNPKGTYVGGEFQLTFLGASATLNIAERVAGPTYDSPASRAKDFMVTGDFKIGF